MINSASSLAGGEFNLTSSIHSLCKVFLLLQKPLLLNVPGAEIPPPLFPPLNIEDFRPQIVYLLSIILNSLIIAFSFMALNSIYIAIPNIYSIYIVIPAFLAHLHLISNKDLKLNISTCKLFIHTLSLLLPVWATPFF